MHTPIHPHTQIPTGSAVVIGEWGGWGKTPEDQTWQETLAEYLIKEGFTDQFCAFSVDCLVCLWVGVAVAFQ